MDSKIKTSREIDIVGSVKRVLAEPKLLMKFFIVFSVIGVVFALTRQKHFTSTVLLAPESTEASSLGQLGSVGSMFGINLGSMTNSDAIYPEIYPEVISSNDFVVGLFDVPVTCLDSVNARPYFRHILSANKPSFWQYPIIWVKKLFEDPNAKKLGEKIDPFHLTKQEMVIVETIRGSILTEVDKKTSMITISVTDKDPKVAALLSDTVMNRLQQYIIYYRTKKARHDLKYAEELYQQSKKEYIEAQAKYVSAADANINVTLQSVIAEIDDLRNEMELKFGVYSEISKQVQAARTRVQEQTPAFTVIQSATIPIKPSSTPKIIVAMAFAVLGVVADVAWVLFIRDVVRLRKKK